MILYEAGKEYWTVARRYHLHRNDTPLIRPVAVRDMQNMLPHTTNPAVKRRIQNFIAKHMPPPPKGDNPGPRFA